MRESDDHQRGSHPVSDFSARQGKLAPGERGARTKALAGGATRSYFGHDEWAAFAPGMKTLEDARGLRSRILSAFELARSSLGAPGPRRTQQPAGQTGLTAQMENSA